MISVDSYLERVLGVVTPLTPKPIRVAEALGLTLAEHVFATRNMPPFDNSSMDGYAVIAADVDARQLPATLRVIGEVAAGDLPSVTVTPGTAVRIMTGASLPEGADAVVPVESTDGGTETVAITAGVTAGAYIRRAGEDLANGALAVARGEIVNPRNTALLAACDRLYVQAHSRPRVTVLTTGNELVVAGQPVGPGQIVDSNGPLLVAALSACGADVRHIGPVADTAEAVHAALEAASANSDLIITSGGVSMGAHDTMKAVLQELGGVEFAKIAMNPGMPQGCGTVHGTPIITLPGNPVSSYVSFEVFVRPALAKLQGRTDERRPWREATVTVAFDSPAGKRQYARGILQGQDALTVTPVRGQGSHFLGGLAHANCLIEVPETVATVAAGSKVKVLDLR